MRPRGSSSSNMARTRLALRKIENSTARQVTYSKRKDGMIKKANELAVLCDTEVAIIMFSPSGRLTCFSSKRRVEDVFLRFLDRPEELNGGSIATKQLMIQKLRKLKYEAEMVEKMAYIEELQQKLEELNQRKHAASMKMSHYQPNLEKINSSVDANGHLRFLESALRRTQMARAKLLGKAVVVDGLGDAEGIIPNSEEESAFSVVDESSTPNQYAGLQQASVLSESSVVNQYAGLQQARGIGIPAMELNVDNLLRIGQNMNYLDYIRMAQNQRYMSRPYPGAYL